MTNAQQKALIENNTIRAYNLATQITNQYDYVSFQDAWQDAKELNYSREVFEAAYEIAEEIWENKED